LPIHRIEVALNGGMFDAQGHIDAQRIKNSCGIEVIVEYRKIFTEDLDLSADDLQRFCRALANPVTHTATIGTAPAGNFDHAI